jgi:intraflagellar transport protein 172
VTAVASNVEGNAIVSAHLDGSVYRFIFDDSGGGPQAYALFAHHPCVPYALAWGQAVVVAGNDGQVTFYDQYGGVERTFDYATDPQCKEFSCACFNPTGETAVVGNFNRFYAFSLDQRTGSWEETGIKDVENMYTVTGLSWKPDGSRLAVGTLCGVLDLYDACIRRCRYKGKFEFTYVSLSQIIVKRLSTGTRNMIKSHFGLEITKINIFQDRYVVAHTNDTLLVGDLETFKLSEIQWHGGGEEKFVFDNPSVCLVFYAGELSIVEYGQNEVLSSVRTDYISGHLLSVRINEKPPRRGPEDAYAGHAAGGAVENKKIAYLLDAQTITVKDLVRQASSTVNHDSRIDFLELNGRANLLLFRDKRRQLHLFDLDTQARTTLLNFCTYVQWVPDSDVVVAQNRNNLCVWYNIHAPDQVTVHQIKGDIEEIERSFGRTEVIVDEGISAASYVLDEAPIEFGTAMDDGNYMRAMEILEGLEVTPEAEAMWQQLGDMALAFGDLRIAERCAAALGDVSKARYLHRVNKMSDRMASEMGGTAADGREHWIVRSKMALLKRDVRLAEDILMAQGRTKETVDMYQMLHRFEDAIAVAGTRAYTKAEVDSMKGDYYRRMLETGQEERAAAMKENEGQYTQAIDLYLNGGLPAKAAKVISQHNITHPPQLLETVASSLSAAGMHEKAGEFYEKMDQTQRAYDSYLKGHAYRKAVELARRVFPSQVVALQEAWGDYLVTQKQVDMAINHYIEANAHTKAIEAALNSRQWSRALQMVVALADKDAAKPYYRRLGRYYEESKQYEEAERCYCAADAPNLAVEMYTRANRWEVAHKLAMSYMSEREVTVLYITQAQRLEAQGKLKEAEKLYVTVNEPDLAINMYKKQRKYDAMVRLVATHRKELLKETHLYLAQQLEMEGNFRDAERHYAEAEEWLSAVNMYRSNDMWEEAIRVAKFHGGPFRPLPLAMSDHVTYTVLVGACRSCRVKARGIRVGSGLGSGGRREAAEQAGADRAGDRLRHRDACLRTRLRAVAGVPAPQAA